MPDISEAKGQFFSLFNLPETRFKKEALIKLGQVMAITRSYGSSPIDSGYVYLGQFITHDITRLKRGENPNFEPYATINDITQLRTPSLELDSVYGDGFDDPEVAVLRDTGEMQLDYTYNEQSKPVSRNDLPRHNNLKPKIKDNRNDEHLIIAQLHVQFLKLHNFFIKKLQSGRKRPLAAREVFEQAKTQCILHYQQVVLYDFLYEMLDLRVWRYVILNQVKTLWEPTFAEEPKMPIEFSGAFLKFGHSMVRRDYKVNNKFGNVSINTLALFTGAGGMNKHSGLPDDAVIDWLLYFKMPSIQRQPKEFNLSERINLAISLTAPFRKKTMSISNLLRGNQLPLPDAQTLVQHLLKKHPVLARHLHLSLLTPQELNPVVDIFINDSNKTTKILDQVGKQYGFDRKTPLWYYILAEAQCKSDGYKLGPLGSLIVAEVIHSLILLTQPSSLAGANWQSDFITPTGNNGGKKHLKFIDLLLAVNPGMPEP